MKIAFTKVRDVKSPCKGHENDAGIDFFIPNDYLQGVGGSYSLINGEDVCIPSGIKVDLPMGYALVAFNKSGVATKMNLQIGACVIDEGYQGEIHLHLRNIGCEGVPIQAGQKIAQFMLLPVPKVDLLEVNNKDMQFIHESRNSSRKDGAMGSTGTD